MEQERNTVSVSAYRLSGNSLDHLHIPHVQPVRPQAPLTVPSSDSPSIPRLTSQHNLSAANTTPPSQLLGNSKDPSVLLSFQISDI